MVVITVVMYIYMAVFYSKDKFSYFNVFYFGKTMTGQTAMVVTDSGYGYNMVIMPAAPNYDYPGYQFIFLADKSGHVPGHCRSS